MQNSDMIFMLLCNIRILSWMLHGVRMEAKRMQELDSKRLINRCCE